MPNMTAGGSRRSPASLCAATFIGAAFLLATGPAIAEVDGARLAQATRSANAFVALAAGSETSGAAPRESDPMVAELFARILDTTVFGMEGPGAPGPNLEDAAAAATLLENGTRMLTAYMLAGTGKGSLEALAEDARALARADENMATYAPEVGRIYDFTARMQGVVADAVAAFQGAASPEEEKAIEAGLADLRSGMVQTFGAILSDIGDDTFDLDWQKQRTAVLGDVGPRIARLLAEADLVALRAQVTALAGAASDTSLKSELQRLALVLKASQ
ncbi:MAG: hypothetical protein H7Y08_02300 [Rhizobiaceae bacterium]|nr:hypothetical protein [Rhizobiaceae bacterium]